MTELISEIHKGSRGTYGAPRIHEALKAGGIRCGLNRVARLVKEAGLRSKVKRKFKATTNSKHDHPIAPNLPNQDFKTYSPNAMARWTWR